MTLYAVFSDIHANYPALLAAARDARAIARRDDDGRVTFISLGDVVDYGPQPNECVAWVRRHSAITIQGNHDRVVAAPLTSAPIEIEHSLWPILLWTRAELREQHRQALSRWRHQPGTSALHATFTLFHSDLHESDAYIDNPRIARRTLDYLQTAYGLFGHTHLQGAYVEAGASAETLYAWPIGASPTALRSAQIVPTAHWLPLPADGRRMILNPGSIGQPRQLLQRGISILAPDYRAAYLLLRQSAENQWEVRFQRVEYPIQETVRLMRERVSWGKQALWSKTVLASIQGSETPDVHPFSRALYETLAAMETLLPELRERLIGQLRPAEMYQ